MVLKKIKPLVLVVMIVLILAGSLYTPSATEGLWVFGQFFEVLCEECRGNWRTCCERLCYDDMGEYAHSDSFNPDKWATCVNNCVTGLAGICTLY